MPDRTRHGTRPVVVLDGTPLRDDLAALVEEVVVDSALHVPDMVEVRLRDEAHDVLGRLGVRLGSTLVVTATRRGDGRQTELVRAEVTALEAEFGAGGSRTLLRGYDASHRLTRGRRSAAYTDVTDDDVVRAVAARAGLPLGRVDASTTTHPHVAQVDATDWEFLRARAAETGHDVAVVAGALEWRRPAEAAAAPDPLGASDGEPQALQLALGTNLLSFRPRLTAGGQVAEVEVRGWDPDRKVPVVARARAQTVAAAAGAPPDGTGVHVRGGPLSSQGEADASAAALAERLASAHAEADAVAVGDPRLVAGVAVSVGQAGWPYDGRYTLTSARHVYDAAGYRTVLSISGRHDRSLGGLVTGSAPAPPVLAGVVPALVTDVDDPEQQGRVRLQLPWLSEDYETWWARTAFLGAGAGRGAVWLPEVGDEVLVAFEHGDPRRPYVLGGLYNGVDRPRLGDGLVDATDGSVRRRGFVSRAGHRLVFLDGDDASGVALLSGGDGLRLSLNQTTTTVAISSDGSVAITGSREVTVRSDGAVSLEAGTTLTLKAGAGVTVDGGPKVAVSGGVITLN